MCLDLAVSCPSRCVLADGKKVPQACRAVNLSQSFSGTDSVFRFATLRERTCQSPSRPYRRRDGIAEWCKPLGNRTGSRSRGQTAFFASLRYAKERVSPRRGRTGGGTGSPSGASLWGIAPDLAQARQALCGGGLWSGILQRVGLDQSRLKVLGCRRMIAQSQRLLATHWRDVTTQNALWCS